MVYDRLFLGKHTLDQVALGTLLGIWTAFFIHLCFRDKIFSHITEITIGPGALSSQKAIRYILNAFGIASCLYGVTVITIILVKTFSTTD